jgi:aminopeptidase YwaD
MRSLGSNRATEPTELTELTEQEEKRQGKCTGLGWTPRRTEGARFFRLCVLCGSVASFAVASAAQDATPAPAEAIRAHLEFLAGDALRGRGSATHDEWVAATYVAAQLRQLGLDPAGDDGGYLQRVELERRRLASSVLTLRAGAGEKAREERFTHGRELVVARPGAPRASGPLRRLRADAPPPADEVRGRVLLVEGAPVDRSGLGRLLSAGPAALLVARSRDDRRWQALASTPIPMPVRLKDAPPESSGRGAVLLVDAPVLEWLKDVRDGTPVQVATDEASPEAATTWNVLARLPGRGPDADRAVLLSAHLDHLGTNPALTGDTTYNGADDDASGVAAVLELARVLVREGPGRRTALFAFFGSEELGSVGSGYFLEHPPVPLEDIVVNLQFEMVGRPDPAVPAGTVWLTGFERSDLGEALARQGAPLVADPHPRENFFQRSDNYGLARRGVVAHTVSTFGLHPDYHGVDDEVDRIDFPHLAGVVSALARPVRWLLDAGFAPRWKEGPPK